MGSTAPELGGRRGGIHLWMRESKDGTRTPEGTGCCGGAGTAAPAPRLWDGQVPDGAATLQPHKAAVQSGYLGRRGAGTCLGRTTRLEDVVNWGVIEVLHQFGLNKGHLLGAEKPQWTSLRGWLLWAEVGSEAGGTQVMPAPSRSPPGHPCSRTPGAATLLLPAWQNPSPAGGFQHGERMLIECLTC